MFLNSQKSAWLAAVLTAVLFFGMGGSALANPISKITSVSKTVVSKVYDGAKGVGVESARVVKDVGSTAWNATDRAANHIRSAL
jgi:hypothetical protein